ncbi:hypothetical protein G7046_g4085 [Stylonectria norvegica]|nr:hypothetical protein G7046_g4085 [Stylonectria norvegica]
MFRQRKHEQDEGESSSSTTSDSYGLKPWYAPEDCDNSNVDIVFVHGLGGDREKTWRGSAADGTKLEPWPKTLLPSKFPKSRILAFGYDSRPIDQTRLFSKISNKTIRDHAIQLNRSLRHYRRETGTEGRPIIFVCHSLGGLVCKDAFLHASGLDNDDDGDFSKSIAGFVFMGTPHTGSAIADSIGPFATLLRPYRQTNRPLLNLLKTDSEVLGRIHDDFCRRISAHKPGSNMRAIKVFCFWEEYKGKGGYVVSKDSAVIKPFPSAGIASDHTGMVKFTKESDSGFQAFHRELGVIIAEVLQRRSAPRSRLKDVEDVPMESLKMSPLPKDGMNLPRQDCGPWFVMPYAKNEFFTGRSTNLEDLDSWFGEQDTRDYFHKRAAIHGLGGMGKTQVVIQWTYQIRERFPNMSIFWVHASTADRFTDSFSTIAQKCHIPNCDASDPKLLEKVKTWLTRDGQQQRWLMVVDNADDIGVFENQRNSVERMSRYIPDSPYGSILFTTRDKQAAVDLTYNRKLFELKEFGIDDAVQLLRKRMPHDLYEDPDLEVLAEHLGCLPLALSQASAYLQKKSTSVAEYLRKLDASSGADAELMRMLEDEFREPNRDREFGEQVPNAVAKTWLVSFQAIEERDKFAIELLNLAGCVDRQEIPHSFFSEYASKYEWYNVDLFEKSRKQRMRPREWYSSIIERIQRRRCAGQSRGNTTGERLSIGDTSLDDALSLLRSYAFIAKGRDESTFTLHRLVHLVVQRRLQSNGQEVEYATKSMVVLHFVCPQNYYFGAMRSLMPHVKAVLGRGEMRLDCFRGEPRKQVEAIYWEAIELLARTGGNAHKDTIHVKSSLGNYLSSMRDNSEAVELLEPLLAQAKKSLGTKCRTTLMVMQSLAEAYSQLGRFGEAGSMLDQVVEAHVERVGAEHSDTFLALRARAWALADEGRLDDALVLARWPMHMVGQDHGDTIVSFNTGRLPYHLLAAVGLDDEALRLITTLWKWAAVLFGEDHPLTLDCAHDLRRAQKLKTAGRPLRETDLLSQGWAKAAEVWSKMHPPTAETPLASQSPFVMGLLDDYRQGHQDLHGLDKDDWRRSWSWTYTSVWKDYSRPLDPHEEHTISLASSLSSLSSG